MMGKPTVAGTRITVEQILEKLAAGETPEQILSEHPRVTAEGIRAAIAFAAEMLRTDIAENIDRVIPLVAHAVAVFGDEQKASHWMATPLALLGDRSPAQVLARGGDVEAIDQILTRIEHNIPS